MRPVLTLIEIFRDSFEYLKNLVLQNTVRYHTSSSRLNTKPVRDGSLYGNNPLRHVAHFAMVIVT